MKDLLIECGEALYGERWQSSLARDLDVADRTVRRWVAGVNPVPSGVFAELSRIAAERADSLNALAHRLVDAA